MLKKVKKQNNSHLLMGLNYRPQFNLCIHYILYINLYRFIYLLHISSYYSKHILYIAL